MSAELRLLHRFSATVFEQLKSECAKPGTGSVNLPPNSEHIVDYEFAAQSLRSRPIHTSCQLQKQHKRPAYDSLLQAASISLCWQPLLIAVMFLSVWLSMYDEKSGSGKLNAQTTPSNIQHRAPDRPDTAINGVVAPYSARGEVEVSWCTLALGISRQDCERAWVALPSRCSWPGRREVSRTSEKTHPADS